MTTTATTKNTRPDRETMFTALWHLFGPEHVRGAVALSVTVVVVMVLLAVTQGVR